MKMNKKMIVLPLLMSALFVAGNATVSQAALTSDTVVNMEVADFAAITSTATINVDPTLADMAAGTITTTDNPITLTIDSSNGSEITFSGNGGTLEDADLALNHGGGWVLADNDGSTPFYSSSSTQNGAELPVNVRISNLSGYEVGNYTNTITFTIVDAE